MKDMPRVDQRVAYTPAYCGNSKELASRRGTVTKLDHPLVRIHWNNGAINSIHHNNLCIVNADGTLQDPS
jgi:biotin synthase-related radical SAM superfamily protein